MWSISKLERKEEWDENHYLSNVLTRYVPQSCPIHVAMHKFDAKSNHEKYCSSHLHQNEDEINIIIAEGDFAMELEFAGKTQIITDSSVVFIPSNTQHSANIIKGNGYFVCIRFPEKAE